MILIGHEDKVAIFKEIVKKGELRHAYLFFGDKEIGKFLFAKSLVHFLEYGEFDADSQNQKPLLDAKFVMTNDRGTIGIEEIREVKNFLWQTPFKSEKRLAIIDDAGKLTSEAQSALLKIVEEPPPHSLIIFIAHDLQALVPPLLSRMNRIYFRRLPEKKIEEFLVSRIGLEESEARKVAGKSFGRIGRAIKMAGKKESKDRLDKSLEEEIQNIILDLWLKDPFRHSQKLSWLLQREAAIKKYNLNPNLQRKAIFEMMNHG